MTKIILVEDDPDDVYFFKSACGALKPDTNIIVLNDGQELIHYLENNDCRDSVILLDLNMPKLGGLDVLEILNENDSVNELVIVTYTTSSSDSDVKAAYQLGVKSYLTKPDSAKELNELIATLTSYWFKFCRFPKKGKKHA
ncbi:response regulator [Aestuariibacter sp. AA17]|uniref:Response regulator n=1 Tax=Fluctibacter corallii TaxID=2984329 RepID=A0ABT3A913_9ALTE|nr:response regulator [Aestuariibacter sp. AA17]MCV2885156.1 response regulator [Aestuariibacter sp. AA17]